MKDNELRRPKLEGHDYSIRHVVINVECLGMNCYVRMYNLKGDSEIEDKVLKTIDYCANQQCVQDNKSGKLNGYCLHCSKADGNFDVWEIAERML